MATSRVIEKPGAREERRGREHRKGAPYRVSWGALFAGAVSALGIWILLYVLGVALGLSTVNPNQADSLRASGIFTGIWGLVTPLVALFIGGMVASRAAGPITRKGGGVHGLVVWSLTAVAGVWLIANLFGGVVGTAVSMSRTAAAAAQAIGQGDTGAAAQPGQEGMAGVSENVQQALPGAGQIGESALEAAPETGTAFWIAFGALTLGLLSSLIGGVVGVSREQRRLAEEGVVPGVGVPAVGMGVGRVAERAPEMAEPHVEQLRQEVAALRTEVREALVRTEGLHH